ncbi:hypothetical protein NCCP2495_19510 [Dietzia sp. NCCP-2495]|uniref:NRDE family protein n=1 Tax=Dietzia sp. NCCP-2495 TaxID=2934675 RepID=UPI002232335B|nr:NRDE family protein [Dietzia sp. NCCP-2495]GLB64072.1 hypothetical protein NCCP2495_19510 [Dietzia sp. NCCP-2495]
MCMLVVARRVHPRYPLIVVANRDEVLDRPTEQMHEWHRAGTGSNGDGYAGNRTVGNGNSGGGITGDGVGGIVAGRDVTAGGTWLALGSGARFAAVTNVREVLPDPPQPPRSRGELPVDALTGPVPVTGFAGHIVDQLDQYGAVNLLAGDLDEMWWASNRSTRGPLRLGTGVHALSNAALDTPWPKVVGAAREVRSLLGTNALEGPGWSGRLLDQLADRRRAPLTHLPRTGVPFWQEWQLSSRFVRIGSWYGTRSTTAIRIDEHGTTDVVERTWDARGRISGTVARTL